MIIIIKDEAKMGKITCFSLMQNAMKDPNFDTKKRSLLD
jgi:hypothetical protein